MYYNYGGFPSYNDYLNINAVSTTEEEQDGPSLMRALRILGLLAFLGLSAPYLPEVGPPGAAAMPLSPCRRVTMGDQYLEEQQRRLELERRLFLEQENRRLREELESLQKACRREGS